MDNSNQSNESLPLLSVHREATPYDTSTNNIDDKQCIPVDKAELCLKYGLPSKEESVEIEDFTSFAVICFVTLVGDMTRGIMFPILWPLVQDLGGSTFSQGYIVASLSIGRMMAAPYFGEYNKQSGYYKNILVTCACILVMGSVIFVEAVRFKSIPLLVLAQLTLGIGSGTLGVTRGYVAHTTTKLYRFRYLAYLTSLQYCGFTVTPYLGSSISMFVEGELFLSNYSFFKRFLHINKFTAPGYFLMLLSLVSICSLSTSFVEPTNKVEAINSNAKHLALKNNFGKNTTLSPSKKKTLSERDIAVMGLIALNVVTRGTIACYETLGMNLAASTYNLSDSTTSYIISLCGGLGVVILVLLGLIDSSSQFDDIFIISTGLVFLITGLVYISLFHGSVAYSLSVLLIYSLGFPISNTATMGVFSKVLGSQPQGALFGWFATAGSMARVLFPIFAGVVSSLSGHISLTFILFLLPLVLASSFIFWHSRHLLRSLII